MDTINTQIQEEVIEMKKVFWGLGLTLVFNVAVVAQTQKDSANSPQGNGKTVGQTQRARGHQRLGRARKPFRR